MIPFIIAGGALALALVAALATKTDKSVSEFSIDDIITDYAKFFESKDITKAKAHATKTINRLIKQTDKYKIGKSGSPSDRNKQHIQFQKMYLIVESDNKKFIDKLEEHYIKKYISDPNNLNFNIGSAGKMTKKSGRYFLYFLADAK